MLVSSVRRIGLSAVERQSTCGAGTIEVGYVKKWKRDGGGRYVPRWLCSYIMYSPLSCQLDRCVVSGFAEVLDEVVGGGADRR